MPMLCANLVYLSFDKTGNQAVEGGLYKRYLKIEGKREIVKIPVSPGPV